LGSGFRREERRVCDGVWEQGAGERREQILAVFINRVLERGEEWRGCSGVWEQGAWERRVQILTVFVKRLLEIGEDRFWRCFD